MGSLIIWLVIMVPVSALFTGLGIFAWRRQKPMWFWSGQAVSEEEILDVKAYNRANGIMNRRSRSSLIIMEASRRGNSI